MPSLAIDPASSANTQALPVPESFPAQDGVNQNVATTRANPHTALLPADRLLKQMEFGLEGVAEKLLLSTVGGADNLLASMNEIMERLFIRSALRVTEGNISRAAKLLGINRNTLSKKLRVFDGRS